MSDTLKDAYISFNKRQYSEVIRILEPQVFRFRENFSFFYMLGISCLHQGDYGGAFSYLRRAVDLRENDVNVLLGLAAVYLKRGDTANALRIWLDITDIEPDNVQAQRGLNYLKKNPEPGDFTSFDNDDKLVRFLPQQGRKRKIHPAAVVIPLIIAAAAAVITVPVSRTFILGFFDKTDARPGVAQLALDERKDFLNLKGEHSYILTEKEVEKLFRDIQDYLYDYRDNMAQRDINMLLLSNASEYVKDRARVLEGYTEPPELTGFKDNFDYAEVAAEPDLYNSCYVLWKGKTTNIEESPEAIKFDLLVGYHEEKTLDGVVPVTFDFAVRIVPDQPVEILAKVIAGENGGISLEGLAVHRL